MAKTRVHELAKEFGVESKFVLEKFKEMGEFVKSASSTVELPAEMRFRKEYGDDLKAKQVTEAPAEKPAAKPAAKKAAASAETSVTAESNGAPVEVAEPVAEPEGPTAPKPGPRTAAEVPAETPAEPVAPAAEPSHLPSGPVWVSTALRWRRTSPRSPAHQTNRPTRNWSSSS